MRRWFLVARSSLLLVMTLLSVPAMAQDRPGWARDLPNLPTKAGWYQGLGMAKDAGKG